MCLILMSVLVRFIIVSSIIFLSLFHYFDGMEMMQANTVKENASLFCLIQSTSCHQQGHAGNKTLLQQNPPVVVVVV